MPGHLQGEETEDDTTRPVCSGRERDFLISLPRLPKSEYVAVDNSKGEVQIFLGQVAICIFLLMDFRAFLESSFSKLQNITEMRIKVCTWKARDNYFAMWHRSVLLSHIKVCVVIIHQYLPSSNW